MTGHGEWTRGFITFGAGDKAAHAILLSRHQDLQRWLEVNAPSYGLPTTLDALDDVGKETVTELYQAVSKLDPSTSLSPPPSLLLPRLQILISTSPGLQKTTRNFCALLTDSDSLLSKTIKPKVPLRYRGSKVHRIEEGFVVQAGDVTRGDGMGGESIYGGTFHDEKEGLKVEFEEGTIAMANSGKNTNTSQFFITLATSQTSLKKLTGKYVAFAKVDLTDKASHQCLKRLGGLGDGKGGTRESVWIEECGLVD